MQTLVQTASPVQSISLNPGSKSFLIALADGSLSLWHLESLQELYQHKQHAAVQSLSFTAPDDFYFVSNGKVHLFQTWRVSTTPQNPMCSANPIVTTP